MADYNGIPARCARIFTTIICLLKEKCDASLGHVSHREKVFGQQAAFLVNVDKLAVNRPHSFGSSKYLLCEIPVCVTESNLGQKCTSSKMVTAV